MPFSTSRFERGHGRRIASRWTVPFLVLAAMIASGGERALAQPANDECASAKEFSIDDILAGLPFDDTEITTNATVTTDDPIVDPSGAAMCMVAGDFNPPRCCTPGLQNSHSVWYHGDRPLVTGEGLSPIADTCGSDYDTVINFYYGSACGSLHYLRCNNDSDICSTGSQLAAVDEDTGIDYFGTLGDEVWVQILSYDTTPGGTLQFHLEAAPPPCASDTDCDDGNACTDDTCDSGTCHHPFNTDDCNDGNECTMGDTCSNGVCEGSPKNCLDANPCTSNGVCNPATGCVFPPMPDGSACTDNKLCTLNDECMGGNCVGDAVDCTDLDGDCSVGMCNASTGTCELMAINEGDRCTDDDRCTTGDTCSNGVCESTALNCSSRDDDCNMGVCNPDNGRCEKMPINEGASCDDDDTCTVNDICSNGVCDGAPMDCDDGDACTADTCNRSLGCRHSEMTCDDGNVCTNDTCDSATGCVFTPNTNPCNDGDRCTENDLCSNGVCVGTPFDCENDNSNSNGNNNGNSNSNDNANGNDNGPVQPTPPPVPEDDDDNDGVRNEFDQCPDTPLDVDQVDTNGCEIIPGDQEPEQPVDGGQTNCGQGTGCGALGVASLGLLLLGLVQMKRRRIR